MRLKEKYVIFVSGLLLASFGIALSAKAGLGTSPISAVPYTLSRVFSEISFGNWLNLFSSIQLTVQAIILRKEMTFLKFLMQIIVAFGIGKLTDLSGLILKWWTLHTYAEQFLCMLSGCFVLGLGIWMLLKTEIVTLPGESMNHAISIVWNKNYADVKIIFDICYITVAALLSMCFLKRLEGVREGSLIAAVAIGNIIKVYENVYKKICSKRCRNI